MADLHQKSNPKREAEIDTVGWLFLAVAVLITAAAAPAVVLGALRVSRPQAYGYARTFTATPRTRWTSAMFWARTCLDRKSSWTRLARSLGSPANPMELMAVAWRR
jgi:hypothetical protein